MGQARLSLVFFNGAYLRGKINPGLMLRVQGLVRVMHGIPQMVNPKWQVVQETTEPGGRIKVSGDLSGDCRAIERDD